MPEHEIIGWVVTSLVVIIGLISAVAKPLSDNTKAMTNLTVTMNVLAEKLEESKADLKEHEQEFEDYKEKVRTSQKRQWDVLDTHGEKLIDHEHRLNQIERQNKGKEEQ